MNIHTLDLHFLEHDDTIATYLIETSAGPILIETGPYSTFSHLKEELGKRGVSPEDINHVFLTHIHFDHAGAAWAFAELGATIYVHPVGAPHLQDPSKLISSASRIYGDDMERLWSTIKPIGESQIRQVAHSESFTVGDVTLTAWHTPGHASHHIAWQAGNSLFTGDVAGVRIGDGPVVPPCPPPDIDIEAWKSSIRLIRELEELEILYLTHFGPVSAIDAHLNQLEQALDDWAGWMKPHAENGTPLPEVTAQFKAYASNQLRELGLDEERIIQYEHANPAWMSVAGLLRYWKKRGVISQ